jgi:aubergine-like protein
MYFSNIVIERAKFKQYTKIRVRLSDQRGSAPSIYASSIRQNIRDSKPQMVMCILGSANKDVYDAIKRTCCVEFGVPSQCVTSSILNPNKGGKVTSVLTKIAMQMNCKLGGEIWGVHIPVRILPI